MTAEHVPDAGVVRSRTTTLPPIPTDYDRLELLYEVQTVLAQQDGIEQTCDALLPIVTRALRVRTAVLLDTTGDLLRAFTWAADGIKGSVVDEARDHAQKMLEDFALRRLASANVVSRAALLPGGAAGPALLPRHFVTLPLSLVRGPVFGVFQLEGAIVFHERDLLFINAVSNQLAVALDRHHTKKELETVRIRLEHANRRLTDLQTISKSALDGATVEESLSAVLRAIGPMFGTDVAAVLLTSPDDEKLRHRATIGLESAGDDEISIGSGAAGRIAATGAMFFDDLDDFDDVCSTLRSNGVRSLLGAPMRVRNRVTGVVYVASRKRRAFTHDELQFLELVADRIGTIIDNATLYDQALAAVRGRDAVMGIVSHDLRNPLNSIQMCAELLANVHPQLTKPVAIIKRSVDVMTRLISDLRDAGSIEAGHLSINIGAEDARVLVRDAIDGVRDIAVKKPVRLETRLPVRELVLDCDRIRVIQALTNLLSNAIKFTPQGGTITISVAEAPGGHARFSVEDTGRGIPEGDLPRVYDRYWQARETAHLGSGLGLAIAKGIVEAHGGAISVESRVGHGTTFSIVLPTTHRPSRGGGNAIRAKTTVARTGVRLLVVDDEPSALAALARLLEDEGFTVETALGGLGALRKVREHAPDILIVDAGMPGLKGPDFVRKVREDLAEIPVILLTRRDDQDPADTRQELRGHYIGKPVEIDELVSAIHRELDRGTSS